MVERITVKRTINGTVVPDKVIECATATVNMNAEIGAGVAAVDFTGCAPDPDGWVLVYKRFTNVIEVTKEARPGTVGVTEQHPECKIDHSSEERS